MIAGNAAGSAAGTCVNEVIIKPLIRSIIRALLKQLTMSIVNWINGGNGTGQSSFVRNMALQMQMVGDAVALPFINQVRVALNPSFGAGIASSLLRKYAQTTSVGGYFAANRSTLAAASPNPPAFLAGNWSQGGTPALLSVAMRPENNPYMLEAAAESQRDTLVAQAQTNRRQDVSQGKGFMSWCGAGTSGSSGATGVSPGASCFDSNGKAGTVQTPGSVVQASVEQLLGSDVAQFVNPTDINSALAVIMSAAMQQTFNSIFGGSGLFGASQTSAARPQAITNALQASAAASQAAATAATNAANDKTAQISAYTDAWVTIGGAAQGAQSALSAMRSFCPDQGAAVQTALDTYVTPVVNQGQTVQTTAQTTSTAAQNLLQEATGNSSTLAAHTQALIAMTPTAVDVTTAQGDAASTQKATASSANPLTVTDGTLVDRLNLLTQNAGILTTACFAPQTATPATP